MASILNKVMMLKSKIIYQLAIFLLVPSLTICQNIQIKIFNKTGYNLDSVSFDNFYIGKISKDSLVILSGIKEITLQGDVPLNRPFGIIEYKRRPLNLKPCAMKSKKRKEGSYAFDMLIFETGNDYRLYWKKHE